MSWLKDALERAAKTAAQVILLTVGAAEGFNLFELDFINAAGLAAGGAFLSLLSSVASRGVGDKKSASAAD